MSNSELFGRLCGQNLIAPRPGRTFTAPYPRWYDPNLSCEYHSNTPGHSIENCYGFKHAVWRLIDTKAIQLEETEGPNVRNNPFPNHDGKQVNVIYSDGCEGGELEDIKIPMKDVLKELRAAGYEMIAERKGGKRILKGDEEGLFCECSGVGRRHHIEDCPELKLFIKRMIKLGVLEVPKNIKEQNINMVYSAPPVFKVSPQRPTLVFKVPKPFNYQSDHAVPWRYETIVESNIGIDHDPLLSETKTNVVGEVTRSGRCYIPEKLQKAAKTMKPLEDPKEKSQEDDEEEFLKIMKQSEYDVVEQLKKTPAKISLFSLIMSSEAHRNALKRVLDQSYVCKDITPERVEGIVNAIRASNSITFTENEIAPNISGRPKALHITLKCQGYVIAKVLIDGGSAFNVLPYSTLQQLPVDLSTVEPNSIIVKAFDGTQREIMGDISLQLEIGPTTFMTEFQVMDIEPGYTMLLGRPWIHEAGAVPSTLHQRVKFIVEGKIITIKGEEELLMSKPVAIPYIDCAEDSFQNLKVAEPERQTNSVNQVIVQMMHKNGFQKGKGLGSQLQGIKHPISLPENLGKFGLGYETTERELSILPGEKKIPHIKETFPAPAEIVVLEQVEAVNTLGNAKKISLLIYPSCKTEELNNWESESLDDLLYFE